MVIEQEAVSERKFRPLTVTYAVLDIAVELMTVQANVVLL